jgi:hypothetical protein
MPVFSMDVLQRAAYLYFLWVNLTYTTTCFTQEAVKEKEPHAPNLDFESNPDEEELYFKEPQQLLAVYQELEESNLFYIQNAQVRNTGRNII